MVTHGMLLDREDRQSTQKACLQQTGGMRICFDERRFIHYCWASALRSIKKIPHSDSQRAAHSNFVALSFALIKTSTTIMKFEERVVLLITFVHNETLLFRSSQ